MIDDDFQLFIRIICFCLIALVCLCSFAVASHFIFIIFIIFLWKPDTIMLYISIKWIMNVERNVDKFVNYQNHHTQRDWWLALLITNSADHFHKRKSRWFSIFRFAEEKTTFSNSYFPKTKKNNIIMISMPHIYSDFFIFGKNNLIIAIWVRWSSLIRMQGECGNKLWM